MYFQFIGVFYDLIKFQIDAGDQVLKTHVEEGDKNASYTSARIQNEIIDLCGRTIQEMLFEDVKKSVAYSIMADETADISGKEQLSIGVRFFDERKMIVREECLGFLELNAMDATTIAILIDDFIQNKGIESMKCVGQGYDGATTMSGIHGGVQAILRKNYPKALYFHCASHRLNLVVNDASSVPEIRNTISTVKDIINFFRESVLRRKYVPNIPAFCETRWSIKHKSIAIFKKHFKQMVVGLETLSREGNRETRAKAFQLHSAATKPMFIICVFIIAQFSAMIEPVVNALQSKSLDLLSCSKHINKILSLLNEHRTKVDDDIEDLLDTAGKFAEKFDVELSMPRTTGRQTHRSNQPSTSPSDYWKKSLLIPYIDSLITNLRDRFTEENHPAFSLLSLHPANMLKMTDDEMRTNVNNVGKFYEIENIENELYLWRMTWLEINLSNDQLGDLELSKVLEETKTFFPLLKKALLIALALPCTTCTIERSFSTLRRVKTWLRTKMIADRLTGS